MSTRTVSPARKRRVVVSVPPSKSYTHRALIAAALADGRSTIRNPSPSIDTKLLVDALRQFGVEITTAGGDLIVRGCGGRFARTDRRVYLGNAGTAVRFMASLAAIAPGTTTLTGDADMDNRPMLDLLTALEQAGVTAASEGGHTPLTITGGTLRGGRITLDGGKSSQFLSSLLLAAPYADTEMNIVVNGRVSSAPYIGMTVSVMEAFGAVVVSDGGTYAVRTSRYSPSTYTVETDLSGATFFGSAAAITGATVTIPGVSGRSLQGDRVFFRYMERMGCRVLLHDDGIEISGPPELRGIEADLNGAPDSVPPLAVTAAFARGESALTNIAHLKYKETDRLAALMNELPKLGAVAERRGDGLFIRPGTPGAALIETYNDHRIAMSFAVAGLKTGGMRISNPGCVGKSYPDFWNQIEKFY